MTIISFDEALAIIGVLPSLEPRPNATNIRALTVALVDKLSTIPSQQSVEFGYSGMVEQEEIHALNTTTPWANFNNPGVHPPTNENLTPVQQRDQLGLYQASKEFYDSESNVRRATNVGLNAAVPRKYKRSGGDRIGAKTYKANDDPRAILNALRNTYGRPSPGEKRANEKAFGAGWNPADPIEELYDRLEECFVVAIVAKPAYTREQMIDKALIAIQSTGLFEIAVLEWNRFDDMRDILILAGP